MVKIFRLYLKLTFVFIGSFMSVGFFTKLYQPGVTKSFRHMSEVGKYILKKIKNYNPADVLCAFDIDFTLIQTDHPACYIPNVRKYLKIYNDIERQYPSIDPCVAFFYCFEEPQHLVDAGIYAVLDQLKDIPKIAFTATPTGAFEHVKRLEVLRYQQLLEKQLQFKCNAPEDDFVLEECPSHRGTKPTFYKGVLCSNSEKGTTNKGSVLCAFLRKLNWTPKLVILIDDRSKNLRDASKALKKDFSHTKFIGLKYLGAHDYCPQGITEEAYRDYWANCFSKAQAFETR